MGRVGAAKRSKRASTRRRGGASAMTSRCRSTGHAAPLAPGMELDILLRLMSATRDATPGSWDTFAWLAGGELDGD